MVRRTNGRKPSNRRSSAMVIATTELFLLLVLVSRIASLIHQVS